MIGKEAQWVEDLNRVFTRGNDSLKEIERLRKLIVEARDSEIGSENIFAYEVVRRFILQRLEKGGMPALPLPSISINGKEGPIKETRVLEARLELGWEMGQCVGADIVLFSAERLLNLPELSPKSEAFIFRATQIQAEGLAQCVKDGISILQTEEGSRRLRRWLADDLSPQSIQIEFAAHLLVHTAMVQAQMAGKPFSKKLAQAQEPVSRGVLHEDIAYLKSIGLLQQAEAILKAAHQQLDALQERTAKLAFRAVQSPDPKIAGRAREWHNPKIAARAKEWLNRALEQEPIFRVPCCKDKEALRVPFQRVGSCGEQGGTLDQAKQQNGTTWA